MDTTAIKTKTATTKGQTDNKPFQTFQCLGALVLAKAVVPTAVTERALGICTYSSAFCGTGKRVTCNPAIMWHLHKVISDGCHTAADFKGMQRDLLGREGSVVIQTRTSWGSVPVKVQGMTRKPFRGGGSGRLTHTFTCCVMVLHVTCKNLQWPKACKVAFCRLFMGWKTAEAHHHSISHSQEEN